ncbi:uncharacterized protein N7473_005177 [Penicillium subrubescens]|uniref:Uncharacterized protein n=1 Tax=Penicillium subrubescens TaxID=1316194 RepID=A0A1Q5UNL6_9EURO|nr:uncharacterized protein N7473_005177 [Penicillium subrubescens]KAJ5895778.1 hypothetical protein N7473_005177 [Penicillium subrubescens]OKP14078.1 hypothetical protein PENSUB_184 [Penicillium subrubescens]
MNPVRSEQDWRRTFWVFRHFQLHTLGQTKMELADHRRALVKSTSGWPGAGVLGSLGVFASVCSSSGARGESDYSPDFPDYGIPRLTD